MENDKGNFAGLRVAAFESRRCDDMVRLIEKYGGVAHVSPSMREVPLANNPQAVDFAKAVITGQIDVVVVMTGVGFGHLIDAIDRHVDRQQFIDALSDTVTIARGPKPAKAMRDLGIVATHQVALPNTWREILALIDEKLPVANSVVGVQEYGQPNPSLVAGLEARGAEVVAVKVYNWALPEDEDPLVDNINALADGKIDAVLFTSAHQLDNLLSQADREGRFDEVLGALRSVVVCSIGPTTTERLSHFQLPVDLEPEHPKMGHLVAAAARRAPELLTRKRQISVTLSGPASNALDHNAPWYDSPFMKACRREPTDVTPVWLMRQAGRYMAEYREVRAKTTFLELCKNPALCSEVMLTAVRKLGVDAAIIFSDLLPILEPMGFDLEFAAGEGPVIHNPIREPMDVSRVVELESVDSLHFVMETVQQTRADLPEDMPLIGFSGAPFTLASYAIEGGSSRNYLNTKTLMYRDAGAWQSLMERFVRAITSYLNAQIAAGCQCVQIFDSWVGCLGPDDYRRHVLPHMKQIVAGLTPGVPVINFATGNPALLPLLAESGAAVIGVDWRVRLSDAWQTIGYDKAVQGNLDPATLLADRETIRRQASVVLEMAGGRAGHIFNLGHGVMQQTPVDNAIALVDAVHELSSR